MPNARHDMNNPLLSIVTVVKDDCRRFKETADSIAPLLTHSVEWIIQDASNDNSIFDMLSSLSYRPESAIHYEHHDDRGIYDGMNLAAKRANGEWTWFVNCGDIVLEIPRLSDHTSCILILKTAPRVKQFFLVAYLHMLISHIYMILALGLPASHNGMLYRSDSLKKTPFNAKYRYAADFDQYLNLNRSKARIYQSNPHIKIDSDGFIAGNRFRSFSEYALIHKCNRRFFYSFYWRMRAFIASL